MALVVQKYGGSSVGSVERIKAVAERIRRAREGGDEVVAVVSAMADTTDDLLDLAGQLSARPPLRELDQLLATGEAQSMALVALALHEVGVPAISLSGPQAGIRTTGPYGKARISGIKPTRLRRQLAAGNVVIVAGFQGLNRADDVTTLGRGGSDTTAVALAAALEADRCEIYTDVAGVYTADPRLVPEARKLDRIGYAEMAELAWRGAKVMHPRAIELGQLHGVEILVASSFADEPGTLITDRARDERAGGSNGGSSGMENVNTIGGIAYDVGVARVTVADVPSGTATLAAIFGPLAEAEVSVDVIVVESTAGKSGRSDVSFTVAEKELATVEPVVRRAAGALGASDVSLAGGFAKVSAVGTGMLNRPGYAARMFKALAQGKIDVQMVTTSEIQVTCVIAKDRVEEAVRRLHRAFGLEASSRST
jgi:aspartate kinase